MKTLTSALVLLFLTMEPEEKNAEGCSDFQCKD